MLLGLLDVRLVERVDPEDDPGDRGGDLPADELAAEVDRVVERDPDDRVPGRLEGGQQVVGRGAVGGGAGPLESASESRTKSRSAP